MKKLYEKNKILFVTVIVLVIVALFYLFCYSSWAFFMNGEYSFRGNTYYVQPFGAFTMTDDKGETHTGSLKPRDYNLLSNDGWYILTDDTEGKSYEVIRGSETVENKKNNIRTTTYFLEFKCPVCDSSYFGGEKHDTVNRNSLNSNDVCADCIFSKNKYIELTHDKSIFDESAHIIDGNCDICGKEASYTDKFEEYCSDHLGKLAETANSVIPHWADNEEIDISEFYAGFNYLFQIGTKEMRDNGYTFEIEVPEEGLECYTYDIIHNELVRDERQPNEIVNLMPNMTGKVNIKIGSNGTGTIVMKVVTPEGEKSIRLIKSRS